MTSSGWPFPDLEPLSGEPQSALVKDAKTGNRSGQKSLQVDRNILPHVIPGSR